MGGEAEAGAAGVAVDMGVPSGLVRCIVTTPGTRDRAQAMLEGWYGKIIGAILGFVIGRGLLGALVGLVVGHQFDLLARRNSGGGLAQRRAPGAVAPDGQGQAGDPAELRRAFFEATFQVMGHVAKSDGRVTEQEIDAAREAMRRFSLGENERQRAIELFTAGKAPDFPLEGTLERLRWLAGDSGDLCRLFVQIQLEAALQGNGLGDRARGVFLRMCRTLGISPLEFASLEAMLRMHRGAYGGFGPGARAGGAGQGRAGADAAKAARLADAYEVLGVAATAPDSEVTRAFRKLMSQNHPDKLVAQGLPESMVAAAHERTQRILEAYETIKNHRGIK
jgi:DnaJ like chaperone protein